MSSNQNEQLLNEIKELKMTLGSVVNLTNIIYEEVQLTKFTSEFTQLQVRGIVDWIEDSKIKDISVYVDEIRVIAQSISDQILPELSGFRKGLDDILVSSERRFVKIVEEAHSGFKEIGSEITQLVDKHLIYLRDDVRCEMIGVKDHFTAEFENHFKMISVRFSDIAQSVRDQTIALNEFIVKLFTESDAYVSAKYDLAASMESASQQLMEFKQILDAVRTVQTDIMTAFDDLRDAQSKLVDLTLAILSSINFRREYVDKTQAAENIAQVLHLTKEIIKPQGKKRL